MGKLIDFTSRYGTDYTLAFEKASYAYGGGLAIEVHCREKGEGWWEPYATLTKNLYPVGDSQAYLDENNLPDLVERVIAEGWAVPIGADTSGFCIYPLVQFTDEFLDEICYDAEKGDVL
jgi:hypothetical protein